MNARRVAEIALLAIGLLLPVGYVSGIDTLQAIGHLTVASPLPLVFTDRDGMEDFGSQYTLRWTRADGTSSEKSITSKDFARISGPLNRKGVYAAAIAYPPRLTPNLWGPVLVAGFCTNRVLANAIGEPAPIRVIELTVSTRTRGRHDQWRFTVTCP